RVPPSSPSSVRIAHEARFNELRPRARTASGRSARAGPSPRGREPVEMVIATTMSDFVSYLSAAISEGSITALAALGFLLTYKATDVISFDQGAFISLGAYLAYWGSREQGWPVLIACLFALVAMFAVGVASEQIAFRPLRGRSI